MAKFFEGKKTLVSGALLVLLGLAVGAGYVEPTDELVEGAKLALTGAVAMFLRLGLQKASS